MAKIAKKNQSVTTTSNLPMVVTGNVPTFKTRAITYAHTLQAVKLANDMANYQALAIQAAQNEFSGIKPTVSSNKPVTASKINAFGNSKGYGDKYPKLGTSAYSIWQACERLEIDINTVTKFAVYDLSRMGLKYGLNNEKYVNDNNLAIEVNSYKKWLKNHQAV